MKKLYNSPIVELVCVNSLDIIAASGSLAFDAGEGVNDQEITIGGRL